MRKPLNNRRLLLSLVVVVVITGLVFGGITLASASKSLSFDSQAQPVEPTPSPVTPPPPASRIVNQTVFSRTPEEEDAWREQMMEEGKKRGDFAYSVCGPETMGAKISVAGKTIKLPDDTYVKEWIVSALCEPGSPCPQGPIYVIARGDSQIVIDGTGWILREEIAQDEEGAFDFLKEALR
ncbi:MAG: hypothetical protein FJ004_02590 [Chloroflexi bacterium]|nr:hypothetical protein [Chloroflexota bacterium]